ncbi:MAG: hypothetical protein ACTSWN_11945 [Promethearchaeota archaeon]
MSEKFIPLTSQLGVAGTSYMIQLGKVGNQFAARIIRGKDIISSLTIDELNGNVIVGFVMRETAIPNLNPYQIMKTVQFLTREAKRNIESMKKKGGIPAPSPSVAPAVESKPVTAAGVDRDLMSEEDIRASYRIVAKPKGDQEIKSSPAEPEKVKRAEPKLVSKTGRKLKPIPGTRVSSPVKSEATQAATASSSIGGTGKQTKTTKEQSVVNLSLAERAEAALKRKKMGASQLQSQVSTSGPLYTGETSTAQPSVSMQDTGDIQSRLGAIEATLKRLEEKIDKIWDELTK